jgi:hypothetical protein
MRLDIAQLLTDMSEIFTKILQSTVVQFALQGQEKCGNCPGAESSLVAAAWANIGYMTHAALLHYVNFTGFGAWAILLYVVAAGGALISVALNSPPRNYVWFFLGPAIYSFLIGTTQEVRGVDWAVAGISRDMEDVWSDAETGLRNSPLLQISDYSGMTINKITGPSQEYKVAMPMLFLDELFSATTNMLVGWTGLNNQLGEGRSDSNLAKIKKDEKNAPPWFLLSSLKAPMVENITNVRIRNPDLRDAFITFLSSECGDAFKKGINSGSYNAATMSRGAVIPQTVMKDPGDGKNSFKKGDDLNEDMEYTKSRFNLNATEIPTPRSLFRLLSEPSDIPGSFGKFSPAFKNEGGAASPMLKLYKQQVNCSSYLWTLIQAMRQEMGHAYWQLIRTAPRGFDSAEDVLFSLFYGWDIRSNGSGEYATANQMKWFTQNLIFTYMLKNELEFAPSITATEQKFAPADQTQQYAQTYVGNVGSKSKSSELYNWALMMPHVQGILLYVIIVAYPLAAMAMVIPGYWKAFFTWVSFFAWIKMWDVGFAMVQVLERSVWAMMGNHSNMARVANMLIQTAQITSGVAASCGGGADGGDVLDKCAVPDVGNSFNGDTADGQDQPEKEAFFYLDKALLLGASIDLNVANGYYLYIMAALYLAVPAVTGQLILGAKAGLGGLATNALGENAKDISGAAKSGFQGEMANQIMSTREHIGQATSAKALRSPSSAFLSSLDTSNRALDKGLQAARLGGISQALDNGGKAAQQRAASFNQMKSTMQNVASDAADISGIGGSPGNSPGNGNGGGSGKKSWFGAGLAATNWGITKGAHVGHAGLELGSNKVAQEAIGRQMNAMQRGADLHWQTAGANQAASGLGAYSKNLGTLGQFQADTAAWEAKNNWAQSASGAAGVYGVNAGSLAPGNKPIDSMGMAMSGMLGKSAGSAADYPGNSFLGYGRGGVEGVVGHGIENHGATYVSGFFEKATPNIVMDTSVTATKEAGLGVIEAVKPTPDPKKQP